MAFLFYMVDKFKSTVNAKINHNNFYTFYFVYPAGVLGFWGLRLGFTAS